MSHAAHEEWTKWWTGLFTDQISSEEAIKQLKTVVDHIMTPVQYVRERSEDCRDGYVRMDKDLCINTERTGYDEKQKNTKIGMFYARACMASFRSNEAENHLTYGAASARCSAIDEDGFNYGPIKRKKSEFPWRIGEDQPSERSYLTNLNTRKNQAGINNMNQIVDVDGFKTEEGDVDGSKLDDLAPQRLIDATWKKAKETCKNSCDVAVLAEMNQALPFGKSEGVADQIAKKHCKQLCENNPFKKTNKVFVNPTNEYARLYMYETDPNRLKRAKNTKGVVAKALQYTAFLSFVALCFQS